MRGESGSEVERQREAQLRLQGGVASRSFADVRVEAIEKIPAKNAGGVVVTGDAAAGLAMKNFVAAIDSDDSLLRLAKPIEGPSAEVAEGGGFYIGEMTLEFREAEQARQRNLHFMLVEKLIELLKEAGSRETLVASLCLASKEESSKNKEFVLWVRLAAKGDSPEQAALRWGLGLTHLQQALLFTSRHLRMQLGQKA
jgi:hypothetical protein